MDTPSSQEPLFPVEPTPPPAPPEQLPVAAAPVPEPLDEPASRSRTVAPGLALFGALLTLAGGFLPLYLIRQAFGFQYGSSSDEQVLLTIMTPWRLEYSGAGQDPASVPGAPLGAPLLLAAMTLLAAAVAGFIHASNRSEGVLARRLTFAGAIFLAGVVVTIGMEGLSWAFRDDPQVRVSISVEPGMWLLILAVPIAAAAAFVTHRQLREPIPAWADPAVAFADTATPPNGIPVQTVDVAITLLPAEPPPADPWAPRRDHG